MSANGRATPLRSELTSGGATGARTERLVQTLNRIYPFLNVRGTNLHGEDFPLVNVHVTFKCNQACPFCHSLPEHPSESPSTETLRTCLERVARLRPGAKFAVTGGEPTLRRDLPELVSLLLAREGLREVEVQTNAVPIGRNPGRFTFAPDHRLRFLVGFHGITESIYDACTRSKGQLAHAIEGVRRLLELGVDVELNCVINASNVDHLATLVEQIPDLFPSPRTPPLHLSLMGMSDHRDVSPLLVRYPRMLASIDEALSAAERRDVSVRLSLSAGHAAVPACLLDDDMRQRCEYPRMYEHEGLSLDAAAARWWRKGEVCTQCRHDDACLGLPRAYAERFGVDELRPVAR